MVSQPTRKGLLNYFCWFFKDEIPEVARLKRNWVIIFSNNFVLGISFAITYPSLHQFITTSTNITATEDIRPGLGLDESFYSWAVAVYSIGELVTALVFAVVAKYTSIKSLCCAALGQLILGSVLYGSACSGWMVIMARFLQGSFLGAQSLVIRVYLGETANLAIKLKCEDPEKSQIKNTLFVASVGLGTLSVGVGPALAPIVAQFPSIDPFRWSGWVVATLGLLSLVVTSLYFVERPYDVNRKGTTFSIRKLRPAVPLYVLLLFLAVFFTNGFSFSIIEALINPFLAANFGFNIESVSYIFILTLVLYCLALITVYVLQKLSMKNKNICIVGFVMGIIGCTILADWQSLPGDPCDQYSYEKFSNNSHSVIDDMYPQEDTQLNISSSVALCPTNNTALCLSMKECLNHSGPPEECFWNQNSRVTGIFCEECVKLCRSRRTSLNFVQLLIGLLIFSPSFLITRTPLSVLVSDGMGKEGQSLVSGIVVATGALPKIIGPLWGNAIFLATGHRTYLIMVVLMSVTFGTLLPYLILYRKLSPRPQVGDNSRSSTLHLEVNVDNDMEDIEEVEGSEGLGRDETAPFFNNTHRLQHLDGDTFELTKV